MMNFCQNVTMFSNVFTGLRGDDGRSVNFLLTLKYRCQGYGQNCVLFLFFFIDL